MNILNTSKIALRALLRNKTRSFLTMLGIIIGIGSVIAMVNIGNSSTAGITNEIASMGSNTIMVMRASQRSGGVNIGSSSVKSLKESDVDEILKWCKNVRAASPTVSSAAQGIYGANNWPVSITGGNESYLEISKIEIAKGVNITADDVANAAKVAVIGQTVADNLFTEGENPLGAVIRLGKIPVQVIGVLESRGQNMMGMDQDDVVIMPYTTVQKRFLAIDYVHMILASASADDNSDVAVEEIQTVLRRTHKIGAGQDDDFDVRSQQQILDTMNSVTGMLAALLGAIAAISLLVGGIGIMNIMYVTVTERTKEIGLRMSVGAKRRDILRQFVIESTILSLIGGIFGILLGAFLAFVTCYFLKWPYSFDAGIVVLAFAVSAGIGIFFGWYPAKKAAGLDPINALRYE